MLPYDQFVVIVEHLTLDVAQAPPTIHDACFDAPVRNLVDVKPDELRNRHGRVRTFSIKGVYIALVSGAGVAGGRDGYSLVPLTVPTSHCISLSARSCLEQTLDLRVEGKLHQT